MSQPRTFSGYSPPLRSVVTVGFGWVTLIALFGCGSATSTTRHGSYPVSCSATMCQAAVIWTTGELHATCWYGRVCTGASARVAVPSGVVTLEVSRRPRADPDLIGPIPHLLLADVHHLVGIAKRRRRLIVYATSLPILAYTIDGMRSVQSAAYPLALSLAHRSSTFSAG